MFSLDTKIASILMDSLTLEELEAMVERKKQEIKINKSPAPVKMTEEEKIRNYCMDYLKKKLHAPK